MRYDEKALKRLFYENLEKSRALLASLIVAEGDNRIRKD